MPPVLRFALASVVAALLSGCAPAEYRQSSDLAAGLPEHKPEILPLTGLLPGDTSATAIAGVEAELALRSGALDRRSATLRPSGGTDAELQARAEALRARAAEMLSRQ